MKNTKINQFFKRKTCENASTSEHVKVSRIEVPTIEEVITSTPQPIPVPTIEEVITSTPVQVSRIEEVTTSMPQRVEVVDDFLNSLERDPGKRSPIWSYSPNHIDQIRRAYLKWGSYRILLEEYPLSGKENHLRRFQHTWFDIFPFWLEYSPSKDAAYCLPCYLFSKEPSVFITTGFKGWKRVRDGKKCAFLKHIGKDLCSSHNNAMKACQDLLNQDGHLRNIFEKQSLCQIKNNRLLLKASIDT
ncbi:unnamed protein product, partial [Trifolium pratense]